MPGLTIILLICALLALGGCGLADIPAQNRAAAEENQQVYEIYRTSAKSLNEQREQSGLPPERIKSFEEWQKSPSAQ